MENRVAKHLEINIVCTYWGLHLTAGPAYQGIFEGVWGCGKMPRNKISSTHTWHINMLMCWHETSWTKNTEDTVFKYTLQHVTAKFAHMNGHWKVYDSVKFSEIQIYWNFWN